MSRNNKRKDTREFKDILKALVKRKYLVILVILIMTGISYYKAYEVDTETYTGTVKVFSGKDENPGEYLVNEISDNTILLETYIELAKTDSFIGNVINSAGVNISTKELKNNIKFGRDSEVPVLTISYTGDNKDEVGKIINIVAKEFENNARDIIKNANTRVIENPKVVVNYPNIARTMGVGIFLGLLIAFSLVLILDYLDTRIKNRDDLESIIPVPIIGEIIFEKKVKKDI